MAVNEQPVEWECPECKRVLPIGDFTRNGKNVRGINKLCLECDRERVRRFRSEHPEYVEHDRVLARDRIRRWRRERRIAS